MRFKLLIAYDGTAYSGWQVQRIGLGVQALVEQALTRLFPHAGRLHGSSRTDAGVHALGMVAHVDVPEDEFHMPVRKLGLALNAHLPADIRIVNAELCAPDFHARFQAISKQYRYSIWNQRGMNPLLRHTSWHVPTPLNLAAMRSAARQLLGRHDFRSFAANRNYEVECTVRTLTRCDIRHAGPLLTFILEADGFLYKMCRGIVGTLVQVGQGKLGSHAIENILSRRERRAAGMTAPAHGLVLWRVYYPASNSNTARPATSHARCSP